MRGRAIKIEVILLDVFTVVSLPVRQPEKAFLQDGIFPVPQSDCETEVLPVVRDSCESILPPPIGTRARLVVRKIVPGITIWAVIFANRAPLTFTQVGSPLSPRHTLNACLLETHCFCSFLHDFAVTG